MRPGRASPSLPSDQIPKLYGKGRHQLIAGGAILVGHNFKYPQRWGNRREPEDGEPEPLIETSPAPPHDSGIGSSSASETTLSMHDSNSALRSLQSTQHHSEGSPSDSAMFLQTNQQFLHKEGFSKDRNKNAEVSMSPSSSCLGSRATDSVIGEERGKLRYHKPEAIGRG